MIEAWWEINRSKAPGLFTREIASAFEQLSVASHSGNAYVVSRPAGTRRILLRRSGYHIYYTVDDGLAVVTVRAVWHAARGRAPRLQ